MSLFSINPVIDACWEELHAQKLLEGSKPAISELDQQAGEGRRTGLDVYRANKADHNTTQAAMADMVDFIHKPSINHGGML